MNSSTETDVAIQAEAPERTEESVGAVHPARRTSARRAELIDLLFVPAVLAGMVGYFVSQSDTFLTTRNLEQILISGAGLGIAAAATTFVIIAGELDLSIGANAALSGVVATTAMTEWSDSVVLGVVLGLLTGLVVGLVSGLITTIFRVPSFVTTLGASFVLAGVALAMTGGSSVSGVPRSFGSLSNTEWLGIRTIVWFAVGVFVVGYLLLHRTAYGIRVFAVGNNREAARLAGIRVDGRTHCHADDRGLRSRPRRRLVVVAAAFGQPGIEQRSRADGDRGRRPRWHRGDRRARVDASHRRRRRPHRDAAQRP